MKHNRILYFAPILMTATMMTYFSVMLMLVLMLAE